MTRRAALCLALSAALLATPRAARAAEPADLVLKNAVVHTVDAKRPRAEAVAVRGNRIVAVGSTADVQAFVGAEDARPRPRGPHRRPRLRRLARPPARHRLRAARRGPRGHAQLRARWSSAWRRR